MEKLLIINEKPSQYRLFSKALGGKDGEYDGYQYHLVHQFGHILELPVPEQTAKAEDKELVGKFTNVKNVPWNHNWFDFSKRVPKSSDVNSIISEIQDYINQGYIPVIASDIDESGEGDLLVRETLNYIGYNGKTYREYHDDETPASIRRALKHSALKVVTTDDPAYRIANARTNMDFMTQQLTRVATLRVLDSGYRLPIKTVKIGKKTKRVSQVVPMGRLKSVILRTIGDQEKKIKAYKPSVVYESRYKLGDLVLSRNDMPKFKTKDDWQAPDLPKQSRVKETGHKNGHTKPPKPYTLSDVCGQMAKFGMTQKSVLALFQKMYEAHILSYPRSEDRFVSPEQFEVAIKQLDTVLDLLELPKAAFTHRNPRPEFVKTGGSHGALRYGATLPTSMEQLVSEFGKNADNLWRVVSTRFVQMYLEDTEWIRYTYETIDTPKPFTGSVRVITKQGVIDPDEKEKPSKLPDLRNMAQLYAHPIKSTKPAKPTAEWLYNQLDKNEVGTGATRAHTVSEMCGKQNKTPINETKLLNLSPLGWTGYAMAQGTIVGSVDGTHYLHKLLKGVKKTGDYETAYADFDNVMAKDIDVIRKMDIDLENSGLEKHETFTGVWQGKDVTVNRIYSDYRFNDDEVQKLLDNETIEIEIKTKNGTRKVTGKLNNLTYNGNSYVGFDAIPVGYARGNWNGKQITFKASYMDYKCTDDDINKLLNGEDIAFETHKDGQTYKLTGHLAEQTFEKNGKSFKYVGIKAQFPLKPGHVRITWQGQEVTIKDSYRDHKFTQDELAKLSNDEVIPVEIHKDGNTYHLEGKLEHQTFTKDGKMYKYVGFNAQFPLKPGYTRGIWRGKTVTFKGSFKDHKFEPKEIEELLAGHDIEFEFTTKSGNKSTVHGKLENQTFDKDGKTIKYVGFKPEWK